MISPEEAQLEVHRKIQAALFDLAVEDDMDDAEVEDLQDAMSNAADLLIEAIDLKVVTVDDDVLATATIDYAPWDDDTSA